MEPDHAAGERLGFYQLQSDMTGGRRSVTALPAEDGRAAVDAVDARIDEKRHFIDQIGLKEASVQNAAAFKEQGMNAEERLQGVQGLRQPAPFRAAALKNIRDAGPAERFQMGVADVGREHGGQVFAGRQRRTGKTQLALRIKDNGKRPALSAAGEGKRRR